ncbi:integral membrane protein (CFEM domain-containing protein) [Stagonosporopsis vannaccii]|nr:integral membrane protein (CFEM domain-containing protein) [Stagonosporopsis vannaccii]
MFIRALVAPVLCLLILSSIGESTSTLGSREFTVGDTPACGLRCLFLQIPRSGCSVDDQDCICRSKELSQSLGSCMLANCTMADIMRTTKVQADLCDLSNESQSRDVMLYTVCVYSFAFLSVMLRLSGKIISKRLSWDDAVVVAALLVTAVPLGCILAMASLGFGEHLWNLKEENLTPILRFLYISWFTYIILRCMIKISLILFYLEIFRTPRYRKISYGLIAYIIINSLVIFFVAIFSSLPVEAFWNWDIKGKWLNIQAAAYANSASAIIQDILLLVLPLVFIRKLQIKKSRKMAVGFMVCIGIFGCVSTVMRIPSLSGFKMSMDPSWDYAPVTTWTELEIAASFFIVSLPSIRILFVRLFSKHIQKIYSKTKGSSKSKSNPTPNVSAPPLQLGSRKSVSWVEISANNSIPSKSRLKDNILRRSIRKFVDKLWPRNLASLVTRSRKAHRRLATPMNDYKESNFAVTRPPYLEKVQEGFSEDAQTCGVRRPTAVLEKVHTRDSRQITALPKIVPTTNSSYSNSAIRQQRKKLLCDDTV